MDIESMVARVWAPAVKPLVEEAWRSYSVGAIRAAITTTWVAVATDLYGKIAILAEDGDAAAAAFTKRVRDAQGNPQNKQKILASMQLEQDVIATARTLELLDGIAERDFDRLKEDRNLCAHPSLRDEDVVFDPRAETARAHLAIALDALLIHPPQQGKGLIEAFKTYLASPTYVHAPVHVAAAYYDNVQPRVRRSLAVVAAKHAPRAIPVEGADAGEVANRAAQVLAVLAQRDRSLADEALRKASEQFHPDPDQLMDAAARLGEMAEFWNVLNDGHCSLLNEFIKSRMRPDGFTPGGYGREAPCPGSRGLTHRTAARTGTRSRVRGTAAFAADVGDVEPSRRLRHHLPGLNAQGRGQLAQCGAVQTVRDTATQCSDFA